MPDLERLRQRLGSRVLVREPLAPHTYFRIGGPADLFLGAEDHDQVVDAWRAANECDVPFRLIGSASNLLIADEGVAGLVVKVMGCATRVETRGDAGERPVVVATAGCQLAAPSAVL